MKRGKFTLVELLVIIGIIAVLSTILLPVFSKAISQSHTAACGNNLRQITMAFQLYKTDNMKYPQPYRWLDDFSPVAKYIQNPRIFRCPARRLDAITDVAMLNGGTDYYVYTGFNINDVSWNSDEGTGSIDGSCNCGGGCGGNGGSDNGRNRNGYCNGNLNGWDNGRNGNRGGGNCGGGNTNSGLPSYYGQFNTGSSSVSSAITFKSKEAIVYDKDGPIHFKGINVARLSDCGVEYRGTMRDLWTLDSLGQLDLLGDQDFPSH